MPEFPLPFRRRRDEDPLSADPRLDALLDGQPLAGSPDPELVALSGLLAAMEAPAAVSELAGEPAALAAFRRTLGVSAARPRHLLRRPAMLSTPFLAAKLAAATAALALSGTAAAAYVGALPATLQNAAHDTIGAPAANGPSGAPNSDTGTATGVGPNLSRGHAAFGLCQAYAAQTSDSGTVNMNAPAFRNLATAAGGAANITTYCKTVAHPGANHPTGQPDTLPSQATGQHGKTSTEPAGESSHRPSSVPTSHASEPGSVPPSQAANPSLPPSGAQGHAQGPPSSVPASDASSGSGSGNRP